MLRWSYGSLLLGGLVALFLSEQATAATYNFYFPKKGGPPKVEQVGEDEDEPVVVAEDDDEDLVEETIVAPRPRRTRRVVTVPSVAPQCASGAIVIPPIVLHANVATESTVSLEEDEEEVVTEYVTPGVDLLTGTNTTPGHRLRPRTRVVRRTLVLDR